MLQSFFSLYELSWLHGCPYATDLLILVFQGCNTKYTACTRSQRAALSDESHYQIGLYSCNRYRPSVRECERECRWQATAVAACILRRNPTCSLLLAEITWIISFFLSSCTLSRVVPQLVAVESKNRSRVPVAAEFHRAGEGTTVNDSDLLWQEGRFDSQMWYTRAIYKGRYEAWRVGESERRGAWSVQRGRKWHVCNSSARDFECWSILFPRTS